MSDSLAFVFIRGDQTFLWRVARLPDFSRTTNQREWTRMSKQSSPWWVSNNSFPLCLWHDRAIVASGKLNPTRIVDSPQLTIESKSGTPRNKYTPIPGYRTTSTSRDAALQ
jgi:hypothetical protein